MCFGGERGGGDGASGRRASDKDMLISLPSLPTESFNPKSTFMFLIDWVWGVLSYLGK